MNILARLLLCLSLPALLAACAGGPLVAPPPGAEVFHDSGFGAPSEAVSARNAFTLSEPMRAYLRQPEFQATLRRLGPERGLVDALYKKGELQLEYDSSITRNAAQTFDARMGNCLSLVLMTAAFAKELGMHVYYQDVLVDELWTRSNGLYFANTHVNLSVAHRREEIGRGFTRDDRMLTIDFLPPEDSAKLRSRPLEEHEIVAMYLNNRAAEALAAGHLDDAYWWSRAAIQTNPRAGNLYNTLGVVYQRHGEPALAERAFKGALQLEPESTIAMHNLVPVLSKLGKEEESKLLAARLATLEPIPPFFYFHKGVDAMGKGQYAEARALFGKEVRRSPYNHEFHFWLALAHWHLGEPVAARDQLRLAVETSTTVDSTERYSAKLAYLRAQTSPQARTY